MENKINYYLSITKQFTSPEFQKDFNLSYYDTNRILNDLIKKGKVFFDGNSNYTVNEKYDWAKEKKAMPKRRKFAMDEFKSKDDDDDDDDNDDDLDDYDFDAQAFEDLLYFSPKNGDDIDDIDDDDEELLEENAYDEKLRDRDLEKLLDGGDDGVDALADMLENINSLPLEDQLTLRDFCSMHLPVYDAKKGRYAVYVVATTAKSYIISSVFRLSEMLNIPMKEVKCLLNNNPRLIANESSKDKATKIVKEFSYLNTIAFIVKKHGKNRYEFDYKSEKEFEDICMDIIEVIVSTSIEQTRQDAIEMVKKFIWSLKIKDNCPSNILKVMERVLDEFNIATDDEYKTLRKAIFK